MINNIFGNSKFNETNENKAAETPKDFAKIEDMKPEILNIEGLKDINGIDITDDILNGTFGELDDYKCVVLDMDDDGVIDTIISTNKFDNNGEASFHDYKEDLVLDTEKCAKFKSEQEGISRNKGNLENIIGDPLSSVSNWHMQQFKDSEAVAAQEIVIKKLLDADVSEEQLRCISIENGWQSAECGMPLSNSDKLLEHFGISTEKGSGKSIDDISKCLSAGGEVIVALDSDTICEALQKSHGLSLQKNSICTAEVAGIDTSEGNVTFNIVHPLLGNVKIPKDDFMESWSASDNFMIEAYK